ncbi:MAG: CaiB/BaiF CoA transferase family protein, partial [Gammaproteobacteria bacterium]
MKFLQGVRVIDCSLLAPGATAMHLADLGAEVIKVEPPGGDYVRELTWPIIEGSSLMHHHVSRGKQSIVIDLRQPEGVTVFRDLVARADVLIEAMRPGALARRGLGYEVLREIRPSLVWCCVSGYGMDGPYRELPAHGIAFDSWAGLVAPATDEAGECFIPEHPSVGMHTGPMLAAMAILAALLRARETGQGACLEIGQADAAAYTDWLRSETWKAYERPESEVTGNASDGHARRAPGTAGMREGVRYQYYRSADGYVLFMASEQRFWRNFCEGLGRLDLFERWPGKRYGDHARGNAELRAILREIFLGRSTQAWVDFGLAHDTAI